MLSLIRTGHLCAWNGPSQLIVTTRGECGDDETLSGYYFREARLLRTLRLAINGREPWVCESAVLDPAALAFTYIYPELTEFGGGGSGQSGDESTTDADGVPHRALSLRVSYNVGLSGLTIRLAIGNHATRPVPAVVSWHLDADFADIQEAQSEKREQHGDVETTVSDGQIRFRYAAPQLPYETVIVPDGPFPWTLTESSAATRVALEPQQVVELSLVVTAGYERSVPAIADAAVREDRLTRWRDSLTRVTAIPNRTAERILGANVRDFASFALAEGPPDEWLALQAGMPLYPALFGRDTLTAGWQAAYLDRGASLDASLTRLGRMQSDRVYEWRDEEPGRIPYQVRRGPLAILDRNPYAAYYADFASPLMFVISLAHLYCWTGERASIDRHWDVARRILDWARTDGDKDRDGYLEYQTRSTKGTKNQGWKDSGDAIVYDDGTPVPAPIGTCELQGYWYAAQQAMAALSAARGAYGDAKALWDSAAALKQRFNVDWWDAREGSIVLALDPEKRQVRAVTSNVGHCLACGIISTEHLPRVVGRLFAPDMFSGWGIRTLSSEHRAYNPLSYHLGTVWAVEQASIVFGLRRFGFDTRALELARALFDLAELYPEYRIPECIGGYPRGATGGPGAYPRANAPQLWNASAFPLLVHCLLGFQPLAALETLVVDPVLPTWLPELVVHDLRVGRAVATLRFWRDRSGHCHAETLHKRGTLRLIHQPPPESLRAGVTDRLTALFDTIRH